MIWMVHEYLSLVATHDTITTINEFKDSEEEKNSTPKG